MTNTMEKTRVIRNIWINRVSYKLIHERFNSAGKKFYSISIPVSKGRFASIAVNPAQMFAMKNLATGEVIPNYKNILLGSPEGERNISMPAPNGGFVTHKVTNKVIAQMVNSNRAAYLAAIKYKFVA